MDMGIKGKRALVCASSKGLGRGCAEALAAEGVDLVLNARGSDALEATAAAIRATHGVDVVTQVVRRREHGRTGIATILLPPWTPIC
jgi:3-oxoacyl-[acyl-carrier protein] reductase